jgi:hypothetical protein
MRRLGRFGAGLLAALGAVGAATSALADEGIATDASERIDDPKLERRLGTRIALGVAPAGAASSEATPPASGTASPTFGRDVVVAEATSPEAQEPVTPKVPRLKLSYRRFAFAQIGPPGAAGSGPSETFNVVALDLYPVSSSWRFGLSTQYGWEDGTFRSNRDAFIAEALSLGGQLPGDVFTPFFELYGGGGLMQRLPAPTLNAHATAYGELGVDVGTEIFFARHAYLSVAGGYLHSENGFVQAKKFTSISGDTLCFKVGFGI